MYFLIKPFYSSHSENRMKSEGNVEDARKFYLNDPPANLKFLLNDRFSWMNSYIKDTDSGIEVGCGIGAARDFIKAKSFLLTDKADYEWLDVKNVDALATPFKNDGFDFVIANNMIHHIPCPIKLFREVNRILKPGGLLLIQDVNMGFFMRLILHLMKHEGYSFEPNVFDESTVCNDPSDLWSANDAIPQLLFENTSKFEKNVPNFKVIRKSYSEFTVFLNSGGVTAKTFYIPLPISLLNIINILDNLLTKFLPSIFALQIQVVLQKIPQK